MGRKGGDESLRVSGARRMPLPPQDDNAQAGEVRQDSSRLITAAGGTAQLAFAQPTRACRKRLRIRNWPIPKGENAGGGAHLCQA